VRVADEPDEAPADRPCPPCRGTGTVISNLGGSPSEVPCPWCDGSGLLLVGHDAQAARRGERDGETEASSSAG
jgi:DnaJ-class molecular chaperone